MINLIPDNIRINNRYALRNVRLARYTALAVLTMAAIVAITGLSILNMDRTENNMQNNQKSKAKNLLATSQYRKKAKNSWMKLLP
jgi:cytochrome bd-type quinol oxidase subunit 2